MAGDNPSTSAELAALARAHLTSKGILDDPWAQTMLRFPWREVAQVSHWCVTSRTLTNPTLAYFAARTRFYDHAVRTALDAGASQVVILGAGYDSRAWRLARPGVCFFEVDHPSTQAAKRARAPAGGPIYVPADFETANPKTLLASAGISDDQTTLYVAEGLLMYLSARRVPSLLAALSHFTAGRGSLVTNFAHGFADHSAGVRGFVRRSLSAIQGEPFRFWLSPGSVRGFLAQTGWAMTTSLTGPQVAGLHLPDWHSSATALNRNGVQFVVATSHPLH